jgi:F0F1-type ATP synthase assembly protein I
LSCYKVWYARPRMDPPARPSFSPAGAGGVLIGTILACVAIAALVGWIAGSTGIGIVVGVVVGLPVGVITVYRKYREAL